MNMYRSVWATLSVHVISDQCRLGCLFMSVIHQARVDCIYVHVLYQASMDWVVWLSHL